MCNFPARKWLDVRRTIAQLADETKDGDVLRMCMRMVMDIDRMRLNHMETGCGCWLAACAEEKLSILDAVWLHEMGVRL